MLRLLATATAQSVHRRGRRLVVRLGLARSIPLPTVLFVKLRLKLHRGDLDAVTMMTKVNERHEMKRGPKPPGVSCRP
jgi:hypothetical protein